MEDVVSSQEKGLSEGTRAALAHVSRTFDDWKGSKPVSDDLVANFVYCYRNGSSNVANNMGATEIEPHKASSCGTMFSHLQRHLKERYGFTLEVKNRDDIYQYIESKGRKEPVKQAKVFSLEDIKRLYDLPPATIPQTRDKIIFAFGICTLARASELHQMEASDLCLKSDGIMVTVRRKKAAASRCIQKIWVNDVFFGWNLLENLKKYLSFIPPKGPLWRAVPPSPKRAMDYKPLGHTTIEQISLKMAKILNVPDLSEYHSHSLRRTGATLMAIAGRTEEQIKVMGNWTSSAAASRYIDTCEVTMRANSEAVAMPKCLFPEATVEKKVGDPPVNPTPIVSEEDQQDVDELMQYAPCPKKTSFTGPLGGVAFTGPVNQVVFVSTSSDVLKNLFSK